MSFSRPYELVLRIFEPLAAHPRWQDEGENAGGDREQVESVLRQDADERLLILPPSPLPPATPGLRMLLPAGQTWDGIERVWPVQQDVLSWGAIQELEETTPTALLDPLVPRSVRRVASIDRMDWLRQEKNDQIFSQIARWQVPFQWWLAFDDSVDEVLEDELPDGTVRIRLRADIMAASARIDWARDVLKDATPEGGPSTIVADFADWLDGFDFNSIVELDLGGMSALHWESDERKLLEDCVDALADDDGDRAQDAFLAYMRAVDSQRLVAHVN